MPDQPDPLSPQARAIRDAPDQPRLAGAFTAEVAQQLRAAQVRDRTPRVTAIGEHLGVTASRRDADGVPVVELLPPGVDPAEPFDAGRAFFLHGGGFTGGLAHDQTSVLMTEALGLPVHSVDYALAPEAPFPAALDQALTAYRALTAAHPGPWVMFGVSAGANLALSLVQRIRAESLVPPLGLGLFSPWTDLVGHGDSRVGNDGRDPVIRWTEQLPVGAAAYAGSTPLDDPLVSPIYAPYDPDFPPAIITTGTRDVFLSDCTRLYWALRRAGARAELRVWEDLWHAFNTQPEVPEAAEARSEVARFLLAELGAARV